MDDSRQPTIGAHLGLLWCECIVIMYVVQQRQSHHDDSGRRMGPTGADCTQRADGQMWRRFVCSIRFQPDLHRPRHRTGDLGVPD